MRTRGARALARCGPRLPPAGCGVRGAHRARVSPLTRFCAGVEGRQEGAGAGGRQQGEPGGHGGQVRLKPARAGRQRHGCGSCTARYAGAWRGGPHTTAPCKRTDSTQGLVPRLGRGRRRALVPPGACAELAGRARLRARGVHGFSGAQRAPSRPVAAPLLRACRASPPPRAARGRAARSCRVAHATQPARSRLCWPRLPWRPRAGLP